MDSKEIITLIQKGESSKIQFKERTPHADSLAHEMIAFANSWGGVIIFGVNDKTGSLNGLSFEEVRQLNQQLVNIASQKIYPPVYLVTETVLVEGHSLLVVSIEEGHGKPYKDSNGTIYVKNGSDKRKVTSNDEIARLLQGGGNFYADELPVRETSIDDIDRELFNQFILRKYQRSLDDLDVSIEKVFKNLNLLKNGVLTLAGLLLFSKSRHCVRPQFSVQCVSVDASIVENSFFDNEGPFEGTLSWVFRQTMDFIGRNMKKIPESEGFNSYTKWEIPYGVFEEFIVNALVHRDYFIASTVKVYIYSDKIEIVSPGRLPNSLTVENVKNGISIARNPILLSVAQYMLPYKGLGTGILRSYSLYPNIVLENKVEENQFKVIIARNG